MKKHGTTILLILIFVLGLGLLLYPTVSDWWNSRHQSKAIASYSENVNSMKEEEKKDYISEARRFNETLTKRAGYQFLSENELAEYKKVLDITGTGIMAYIEIPSIDVSLPVYHTVSESVLQIAVGHIEWTSLPVGGKSTHCVLSGHRGLPSAKLFTNLDKLAVGDVFIINTVGETFTYRVFEILIVEPEDISALAIEEGRDLCTLVTCTPFGVNTHRLLVRGERTDYEEAIVEVEEMEEAVDTQSAWTRQYYRGILIGIAGLCFLLTIYGMIQTKGDGWS